MMATPYSKSIAELSLDKQELSLLLSPEAEDASIIPLSFAQRRLWFIEQISRAPHIYTICRLGGVMKDCGPHLNS